MLKAHIDCDIGVIHIHFLLNHIDNFLTVLTAADDIDHAVPFRVDGRQGLLEHVPAIIITAVIFILLYSYAQLFKSQLMELLALVVVEVGSAAEPSREDDEPHYNCIILVLGYLDYMNFSPKPR